jgi:hypothetical protein
VDFASPETKTIAITRSENNLDGRRLLIKDGKTVLVVLTIVIHTYAGDDFTGRPSGSTQPDGEASAEQKSKLTGHSKTAQKILMSQKQPAGPTLFLGNLGFETTEQSIRDLFNRHRIVKVVGEDANDTNDANTENKEFKMDAWIRKIRMGTFEDSGKCKGYAISF